MNGDDEDDGIGQDDEEDSDSTSKTSTSSIRINDPSDTTLREVLELPEDEEDVDVDVIQGENSGKYSTFTRSKAQTGRLTYISFLF